MQEHTQDDIQAYLSDTLSPEQRAAFEVQVSGSPALTEEVNRHRMLRVMLQQEYLLNAKSLIGGIMAATEIQADYGEYGPMLDKPRRGRIFLRRLWIVVAAFLVLVSLWWLNRQQRMEEQPFRASSMPLTPFENIIGFAPGDVSNAATALRAYELGNYPEAIERLQRELRYAPDDNALRLYLAVSFLMQGQNAAAEPLLRQLVAAQDLTTVPATWYLGWCLLQQGKRDEARSMFHGIQSDIIFGQRTRQLLDTL
jgi:tetratricopeptide (TPR) repeat protein